MKILNNLNVNDNKVNNVDDPVEDQDIVTKAFLESRGSTSTDPDSFVKRDSEGAVETTKLKLGSWSIKETATGSLGLFV